MFEPKATAPHLDSTATTFIITYSPSRSNRRGGFSFSEERGAGRGSRHGPSRVCSRQGIQRNHYLVFFQLKIRDGD